MAKWIYRRVRGKWGDVGEWKVVDIDPTKHTDWVHCEPIDSTARELAKLSTDGRMWFRKRDLTEVTAEDTPQETLI